MKVRLFRRDDGLFNVICEPRIITGIPAVATKGVAKENIGNVVLVTAVKADEIKAALKAARKAVLPP